MCRKPALAATALAFVLLAGPALAWPGGKSRKAEAKPAAAATPQPTLGVQGVQSAAEAAPPRVKATPAERAAADRLDPLARAAFWSKALNDDPRDLEAGIKLSKALRALGRNAEAVPVAQQVLALDPTNYEGLLELARANIGAGDAFFALQPLEQARRQNPRDWRPVSMAAIAYEATKQPDQAAAAFAEALRLAPDSPALLTNHALFLAGRGQVQAAEAEARKAAALPGAGPPERQNLALVLGLSGRLDEAEKLIRRDLPPAAADANLAYLRAMQGPGARSWAGMKATP
jgi:Flp pilus assembly protein TadD